MPSREKTTRAIVRADAGRHTPLARRILGKTSLSDSLIKKICKVVAKGNYESSACRLNGVSPDRLREWKKIGKGIVEREIGEEHCTNHEIQCAKFFLALEAANAKAQELLVAVVFNEAVTGKNWLAAMTLLERKNPELYGRNNISRGGGTGDGAISIHIGLAPGIQAKVEGEPTQPAIDAESERVERGRLFAPDTAETES